MPRKITTPNFKEMQAGLAKAESLYNLKAQVEALYKDAIKGEKTPGEEVQELEDLMHKVMDAFGIKYGSTPPETPKPQIPVAGILKR